MPMGGGGVGRSCTSPKPILDFQRPQFSQTTRFPYIEKLAIVGCRALTKRIASIPYIYYEPTGESKKLSASAAKSKQPKMSWH